MARVADIDDNDSSVPLYTLSKNLYHPPLMKRGERKRARAAGTPPPPRLPPRAPAFAIAAAALVAFVVFALANIRAMAPTTDETTHLGAGYSYLAAHDFRLNPEHPPLLKMIAALPLRAMPVWPSARESAGLQAAAPLHEAWAMAVAHPMAQWYYAHHLLYSVRDATLARLGVDALHVPSTARLAQADFLNDVTSMFTRARIAMLLFGLLLAAAIFLWSSEAWGVWGGALSVLLFCFDPTFLAHSGLVATDVGVTFFFFAAIWCFWRVCRRFSWPNVGAFALCFGLAQVAKFTALLLVPIVIAIALLHERRQLARVAGAIGIAFATAAVVVWAAYGFRFSMVPDPAKAAAEEAAARTTLTQAELTAPPTDGHPPIRRVVEEAAARRALLPEYPAGPPDVAVRRARATTPVGLFGRMLLVADRAHLLPEAYLHGLALLQSSSITRNSFLRGEYSSTGFPDYFLWTFLYKTPLPALAAIAMALVIAIRRRPPGLLPFLAWPVAIYLVVSLQSNVNIGHRHLLPIYPFLYVLCGGLTLAWQEMAERRRAILAIVSILTIVAPSFFVFGRHPAPMWGRQLSYLNELAGGPEAGYTKLVDSNFDWGQDLMRLGEWLRARHIDEPINLLYSGTADPRYYGVRHYNMALGYFAEPQLAPEQVTLPGYFAVSAEHYEGAGFAADSRDYWRTFLAQHGATVVGKAGYSIFIYRIEAP
jgi:4-amino-4-deoxy-L-arabinose transferase-like glycosyltransferase